MPETEVALLKFLHSYVSTETIYLIYLTERERERKGSGCGGLRRHICSPLVFVIIVITPYLNCSRSRLSLCCCRCLCLCLSLWPKVQLPHTEISQTLNARQMHFVLQTTTVLAKLKESRSTLDARPVCLLSLGKSWQSKASGRMGEGG